jgi:hypothetical protein
LQNTHSVVDKYSLVKNSLHAMNAPVQKNKRHSIYFTREISCHGPLTRLFVSHSVVDGVVSTVCTDLRLVLRNALYKMDSFGPCN